LRHRYKVTVNPHQSGLIGRGVIRINEAEYGLKRKKSRKQINGKFNNIGSADEIKLKNISLQQFLPQPEADIQGLLHRAQANPALFQSLQLPSTVRKSSCSEIPCIF
jgi:hypothetical protein